MATINDITQGSYYRGDANLAGGNAGVFKPDLSAWQRFSDYTFIVNQEKAKEKNDAFKTQAAQLAASLKIDYSKVHPEHIKLITDKRDELATFIQDHPTALEKSGSADFIKFYRLRNDLENLTGAATERSTEVASILKSNGEKAVNGTQLAALNGAAFSQLDPKDPFKPVKPFAAYQTKPLDLAKATTFSNTWAKGNYLNKDTYTGPNFTTIDTVASTLEIKDGMVEQEEFNHRKDIAKNWNETFAAKLNDPAYVKRDDKGNFVEFTAKALGDGSFGEMASSIREYNAGVQEYNMSSGTKTPARYIDINNGLNETDLKKILILGNTDVKTEHDKVYTGATERHIDAMSSRINANANASDAQVKKSLSERQIYGDPNGSGDSFYDATSYSIKNSPSANKTTLNGAVWIPFADVDIAISGELLRSQKDGILETKPGANNGKPKENLMVGVDANGNIITGTAVLGPDGKFKLDAEGKIAEINPGQPLGSKKIVDTRYAAELGITKAEQGVVANSGPGPSQPPRPAATSKPPTKTPGKIR